MKTKLPWQKAEQRAADLVHGYRQPGSGNKAGFPGDIRQGTLSLPRTQVLLESKQTNAASLRIDTKMLKKITDEATVLGKIPVLTLSIRDEFWVCLPSWAVEEEDDAEGGVESP